MQVYCEKKSYYRLLNNTHVPNVHYSCADNCALAHFVYIHVHMYGMHTHSKLSKMWTVTWNLPIQTCNATVQTKIFLINNGQKL